MAINIMRTYDGALVEFSVRVTQRGDLIASARCLLTVLVGFGCMLYELFYPPPP